MLLVLFASCVEADERLNVSIAEFDPGVPEDRSIHRDLQIFPRIREIEGMLLPFTLRESLASSGHWGAVRVVPERDAAAELLIEGSILQSDGHTLGIRVRASDALGNSWIDKIYAGTAGSEQIFTVVAADLDAELAQLSPDELRRIEEISMLRYGNRLAPSAFDEYLDIDAEGVVTVRRLPSQDDPMVDRIRLIRETEYVITDAVDAKFRGLHADIESVYGLWREYRRKTNEYEQQNAERATASYSAAPRGSYEDLLNRYENYKYARVTAQEQDRLAVAFDNEVGPTVQAMEIRVAELETWVARKYLEWNRLLEELFDVETSEGRAVDEEVVEDINELLD